MFGLLNRPREIFTEDECREIGYVIADCPECYVTHHGREDLRDLGTNWYYCRSCGTDWCDDPTKARDWPLSDIIINVVFVVFLIVGFVGSMFTTALVARHIWHWSADDAAMASLWIGIPAWLVAVTVLTTAARCAAAALGAGIGYVWGEPLS